MNRPLAVLLMLFAGALVGAGSARAFTPESGWWVNPNESGYGFSIEIQDDYLFMVAFAYTNTDPRPATWVAAEGRVINSNFSAPLYSRAGGTCIGCPFQMPGPTVAAGGTVAINFSSETSATMVLAGRTIPIRRFDFYLSRNPAVRPKTELWLGEWQIVMDFSPIPAARDFPFFGEVLVFDFPFDNQNGQIPSSTTVVEGCRPHNSLVGACTDAALLDHEAAVSYSIADGTNFIVVEDDPQTWLVFEVVVGTYQFDGIAKRCPRTIPDDQLVAQCIDNASYPQLPSRGWRSASRAFIRGDDGAPSATAGVAPATAGNSAWRHLPLTVDAGTAPPSATARNDLAASEATLAALVDSIRRRSDAAR